MQDGLTCMAFNVSFLPNTGNKYFIASCDDSIRLFDMETHQVFFTKPSREFMIASWYKPFQECIRITAIVPSLFLV